MKLRCPSGCAEYFFATAHVTEGWKIDNEGDFIDTTSEPHEVIHRPNEDDVITCSKCGVEAIKE